MANDAAVGRPREVCEAKNMRKVMPRYLSKDTRCSMKHANKEGKLLHASSAAVTRLCFLGKLTSHYVTLDQGYLPYPVAICTAINTEYFMRYKL